MLSLFIPKTAVELAVAKQAWLGFSFWVCAIPSSKEIERKECLKLNKLEKKEEGDEEEEEEKAKKILENFVR